MLRRKKLECLPKVSFCQAGLIFESKAGAKLRVWHHEVLQSVNLCPFLDIKDKNEKLFKDKRSSLFCPNASAK